MSPMGERVIECAIAIQRHRAVNSSTNRIGLYVDGRKVGNIGRGESKTWVPLSAGTHGIRFQVARWKSEIVLFHVAKGEVLPIDFSTNPLYGVGFERAAKRGEVPYFLTLLGHRTPLINGELRWPEQGFLGPPSVRPKTSGWWRTYSLFLIFLALVSLWVFHTLPLYVLAALTLFIAGIAAQSLIWKRRRSTQILWTDAKVDLERDNPL